MESQESTRDSSFAEKLKEAIKYHFVDSTSTLAESTPVFAAFETFVAGMSNEVSLNARFLSTGLAYSGIGYLYGKGRDLWRKTFRITDKTLERMQTLNDVAYTAVFNLAISPLIYFISGARDLKEIVVGTLCASFFGALNGVPMGYSVDLFRDLTGLKKSERIPRFVRKTNSKIKKGLCGLLVAASIGLTASVYNLN